MIWFWSLLGLEHQNDGYWNVMSFYLGCCPWVFVLVLSLYLPLGVFVLFPLKIYRSYYFSFFTCRARENPFSRDGFLVRRLGKRAYRKRFGGLSWTSSDPLGSSSNVGQMTDVGSQSDSLTVELFPRMLALCLSHQWSKLACCRISNSCYVLALSDPLMRHSLLSGMENEPAHRVALRPG